MRTIDQVVKFLLDQDMKWARLATANLTRGNRTLGKQQKRFLDGVWSVTLQDLLDVLNKNPHNYDGDDAWDEVCEVLIRKIYPKALAYGYKSNSFLHSSSKPWLGASMLPEQFLDCCSVSVTTEPGGDNATLHATCNLTTPSGREVSFSKSVALAPIVDAIAAELRAIHGQETGEDLAVSGFGDWLKKAAKTARKIAQSKAIKSLYKTATPYLASMVPGGAAALALANKAADVVTKAKAGDQKSLGQVQEVKTLAATGNPKAKRTLGMMKVVKAALELKTVKEATAAKSTSYQRGLSVGFSIPNPLNRLLPRNRKKGKSLARNPNKANDRRGVRGRKQPKNRPANPPIETEEDMIEESAEAMTDLAYDGDEVDAEIAGWIYNRPYRNPLSAAMGTGSGEFPGVGIAVRALYSRGLGG